METKAEALQPTGVSRVIDDLRHVAQRLEEEVSGLGTDLESVMKAIDPCVPESAEDGPAICPIAYTINIAIGSLRMSLEMIRSFRSQLDL